VLLGCENSARNPHGNDARSRDISQSAVVDVGERALQPLERLKTAIWLIAEACPLTARQVDAAQDFQGEAGDKLVTGFVRKAHRPKKLFWAILAGRHRQVGHIA
jgi:hypothetical protein